ncbi:unnamed protein product [Allacma fusca]|uniref:Uncharacterized protein n=1 Tax=Allacma fusca TaxID=39272 RepID=A0A8J2KR45_9HEXA|nr:unnamed protein product [Allacma fusca]
MFGIQSATAAIHQGNNNELFKTIYGFKSSRSLVQDCTFLRKLFHSPPEECRSNLWSNVWALKSINIEEKNFVRTLFSVCGMDLFALSLKFTRSDMATGFIASNGFDRLLECLCTILEPNRMEHVNFETFREPFLNVFKLWLNIPISTQNFLAETSVLLKLFANDKQLYLEFKNQGAEEAFERVILKIVMASRPQNIYSLKQRFNIWHRVSPLLRFLNGLQGSTKWMPAVLLIAELLGLEIQSKEEISNQYTNEMFQIWGVDWFIVSLSFRDDEEKHKWCLRYFGRYLDKLLRVWKTQGNFVKFLTSADFIKILMDVGKSNLEQMSFQVEWDISIYFRLSFVVMCLFDADSNIYDEYHASLSPLFENALNQLFHGIQAKNWNVLEILKEKNLIILLNSRSVVTNLLVLPTPQRDTDLRSYQMPDLYFVATGAYSTEAIFGQETILGAVAIETSTG